jgi:hypothetical protein
MKHANRFASIFGCLSIVAAAGCASLQSVSVTAVPSERGHKVQADASNTAFLGIHFDNDFADGLREDLRRQCPHGRVTGVFTKYETYWVVLVETRTVTATGYCVDAPDVRAAARSVAPPPTRSERAEGGAS